MTDERAWQTQYRHPTPWMVDLPPMSMPEMFEASVARHGAKPAIDFLGRRYRYDQVADGARRVAAGLAALGFGKGDRIGLFLPNVPHYVCLLYTS